MAAVAAESANLENARREIDREETRFREWQEACCQAGRNRSGILQRLKAAVKLTELARVVLRDSAPIVAQQLCDRIAGQAQRIFNRINHDPVEAQVGSCAALQSASDSRGSAICHAFRR